MAVFKREQQTITQTHKKSKEQKALVQKTNTKQTHKKTLNKNQH